MGAKQFIPISDIGNPGRLDKFQIFSNGIPLHIHRDYRFLPENAVHADTIQLAYAPSPSDTLCFEIWTSPILKQRVVTLNKKEDIPILTKENRPIEVPLHASSTVSRQTEPLPQYQLDYGGNKSIQVRMGEGGGMNLEQSLDLDVNGQLSKNLFITGHLSDQEIPIQPEGNTATLKEVDQIFVKIYNQRFSYTLGDYVLRFGETSVDRTIAKVQGMHGMVRFGPIRTTLTASRSRGTYHNYTFNGLFGKQTGYYLQGKNGEPYVTVLAGTETIWLNGNRLTRGKHYQMEYGEGRIDFLNAQVISGENQFTVEFQYIERDFPNALYSGEVADTAGLWTWSLRTIAERDFKDEPEREAYRNQLYFENNGEWVAVKSSLFDSLVLKNVSMYPIRFSKSPSGGYALFDSNYQYIQPDSGDYAPVLPTSKTHSTFATQFKTRDSAKANHLSKAHISLSRLNTDLYTSRESSQFNGLSFEYTGDQSVGKPLNTKGIGQWQLQYNNTYKSENYEPFRQTTENFSYRETWNLEAVNADKDYFAQQGTLAFIPLSPLRLGLEAGKAYTHFSQPRHRQNHSTLVKGFAEWQESVNHILLFSEMKLAEQNSSNLEKTNYKWGGKSNYTLGFVTPGLMFEQNEWIDMPQAGRTHMSLKQTIKGTYHTRPLFKKATLEGEVERLNWQSNFNGHHDGYSDSLSVWELSQRLKLFDLGKWQTDFFIAWQKYEERPDLSGGAQQNRFYLMEWNNRLQNQQKGYAWNTTYRINQTVELPLKPVYIEVSPGTGTHWCRDPILPDCEPSETRNDYELIGLRRDTAFASQQTQDLNWNGNISLSPGRFPFGVKGFLAHTDFALQYRFNFKDTSERHDIVPAFTDDEVRKKSSGETRIRPSIRWTHPKSHKTLTFSLERKFIKQNYPFGTEERFVEQSAAFSFDKNEELRYTFQQDYRNRRRESVSETDDRHTDEWEGYIHIDWTFGGFWSLKPNFRYMFIDGSIRNSNLTLHSLFPRFRMERRWIKGGKSYVEYGLHAGLGAGSTDIFLIAVGYPRRYTHRFEAGIDFRANQYIFCNATYLARLEPRSDDLIQRLSAEVRAMF